MCRLHAGLSANEKVRSKKREGARAEEVGKMFSESVTEGERESERERDIQYTSTNGQTHKKGRAREKKLVTFLGHLKTCKLF